MKRGLLIICALLCACSAEADRLHIGRAYSTIAQSSDPIPVEPAYWELSVQTTASPQTYSFSIDTGTTPSIDVVWGDGTTTNYTSIGVKTHSYATAGVYTQQISGSLGIGTISLYGVGACTPTLVKTTGVIGGITGISGFLNCFRGCTGLTSIPSDLFRWYPAVGNSAFKYTFNNCTGLTSIPSDLFRYNTVVGISGFDSVFRGCTGITSIPVDLFRYNTNLTTVAFQLAFYGCNKITSIPTDLFRYNTKVTTAAFYQTFGECSALTTIPSDLFSYNTLASTTSFSYTFYLCNKLTMQPNIFGADLQTRFTGKTMDFSSFFQLGTFTGVQGTYPALWTVTGATFTTTDTYHGAGTNSASNFADIPAGYK